MAKSEEGKMGPKEAGQKGGETAAKRQGKGQYKDKE